jgi:hypothetical protein
MTDAKSQEKSEEIWSSVYKNAPTL